jgi:photosystem II stability/assembly factor-like uncharacterized protein
MSSTHAATNVWTTRGPTGGNVADVVIDPANDSILYAAASEALFKSLDRGETWTELPHDFGQYTLVDLAIDPSNSAKVFVASLAQGLLATQDGGATFALVGPKPTDANVDAPWRIAISADGQTIYYSTIGAKIFCSTNGGATFVQRDMPRESWSIAIDPNNSAVAYAATSNGVIKTANGGDTWVQLPVPGVSITYINSVALTTGTPNTLWASNAQNVFSTTDDGQNWTPAATTLAGQNLHTNAAYPSVLLATSHEGANARIHRYQNGTWQALGRFDDNINVVAISPGDATSMIIGAQGGIWKSSDGGSTWARSNTGLIASYSRALAAGGGVLYAGSTHGELSRSANGSDFTSVAVSPGYPLLAANREIGALTIHPSDGQIVIAGMNGAGLKVSHDGGVSWSDGSVPLSSSIVEAVAFDPANPLRAYASVSPSGTVPVHSLQVSDDAGLTFNTLANDLPAGIRIQQLRVDPRDSARLFAAALWSFDNTSNGLYRSTDSGATWNRILTNSGTFDTAIDIADSKRVYALAEMKLWISDNGGDSFRAAGPAISASPFVLALDPENRDVLYLLAAEYVGSTATYYVMRSVDRAASWERIPNSTRPQWTPGTLLVDPQHPTVLLASTTRGIQSYDIATDLGVSFLPQSERWPLKSSSSLDLHVENKGPFAATEVQLQIHASQALQVDSVSLGGGSCTVLANVATCSMPAIKVDEPAIARVQYTTASEPGPVDISATVSARENDPILSNNQASASATLQEIVDLVLTGSAPGTVNQGNSFADTFTLRNTAANDSSATTVQITADSNATITSVSPAACTFLANIVDCHLGALATGATTVVTVTATATNAGTLSMSGNATAAPAAMEANPADNAVSVATTSVAVPSSNVSGGSTTPPSPSPSSGSTAGSTHAGGGGGGSTPATFLVVMCLLVAIQLRTRQLRG